MLCQANKCNKIAASIVVEAFQNSIDFRDDDINANDDFN